MKTLSFNIIKPLAFTALLIVFAASFNTAAAGDGCPGGTRCKQLGDICDSDGDCPENSSCRYDAWQAHHLCVPD